VRAPLDQPLLELSKLLIDEMKAIGRPGRKSVFSFSLRHHVMALLDRAIQQARVHGRN